MQTSKDSILQTEFEWVKVIPRNVSLIVLSILAYIYTGTVYEFIVVCPCTLPSANISLCICNVETIVFRNLHLKLDQDICSLVPQPHPAFCRLQYRIVVQFFVRMRGEPGNEARIHGHRFLYVLHLKDCVCTRLAIRFTPSKANV